ncbi:MAG: discoidin domain-containing protein [Candidatus Hydrogenedentota bacterium]
MYKHLIIGISCLIVMTYAGIGLGQNKLIEEIKILDVSKNTITVYFKTTRPSSGVVKYGMFKTKLDNITYSIGPATEHYGTMVDLQEGSEVWFRIECTDTAGVMETTNIYKEETKGIPPLRLIRSDVEGVTDSGGMVVVITNLPTKLWFEASMDIKKLREIVEETEQWSGVYRSYHPIYINGHKIRLDAFPPLTDVYYRFSAEDTLGRSLRSDILSFKTNELNVAIYKPVEGNFDNPRLVTDGGLNYFNSMATSGDPMYKEQWIIVDLEDFVEIDKIITYWRSITRPLDFDIYGSFDKENWKPIAEHLTTDSGTGGLSQTGDPLHILTVDAKGVMYRYLKLYIPKGAKYFKKRRGLDFVQLFEIKVYPVVRMKER